jgi:hypothetical protein
MKGSKMAIEKLLEELIDAVKANTEALLSADEAPAKKAAPAKKKADAEEDDEAPAKKAEPAKKKATVAKKKAKSADLKIEEVLEAFGKFINAGVDEEDIAARKKIAFKIAKAFNVKQIRLLEEADFQDALDMLEEEIENYEAPSEEEEDF